LIESNSLQLIVHTLAAIMLYGEDSAMTLIASEPKYECYNP